VKGVNNTGQITSLQSTKVVIELFYWLNNQSVGKERFIMVKQEAMECLQTLPDTVDWEDIQYALYIIQKVEKGRKEVREGKGIPLDEARKLLGVL